MIYSLYHASEAVFIQSPMQLVSYAGPQFPHVSQFLTLARVGLLPRKTEKIGKYKLITIEGLGAGDIAQINGRDKHMCNLSRT